MSASDGSFDSTFEAVGAALDTTGLADGRHIVFVRGRDASENWGAVSAVFFWVLDPATAPRIAGTVLDANDQSPVEATVTAGAFQTTTDAADGSYTLMVPEGTYDVTAVSPGYAATTAPGVNAVSGGTTPLDFLLAPFEDVFTDDVESGNQGWSADAPWAITSEAASSPTHSWTDSPGGNYADGVDASLTSPILNLWDKAGITLEFDHIFDIESGYDHGHVEYSTDGGQTWVGVASYTGVETDRWLHAVLELPALTGVSSARIRFRLEADGWITEDGWHVDDIRIRGADYIQPGLISRDGFESGDTSGWSRSTP
jgi:hypothetical protein